MQAQVIATVTGWSAFLTLSAPAWLMIGALCWRKDRFGGKR